MKRADILNARFDALTLSQTVDSVFDMLATGRRGWLATVNVSILMMMRSNRRLQGFVDHAALVVADGQPLVWCAPWFGHYLPERVTGVDLVHSICERAAVEGKRVYLLGASAAVVEELAAVLRKRHANLEVDFSDGYFKPSEMQARIGMINASGADILFVGMGVPRQEYFLEENWSGLRAGLAVAVGGSFDVLAGRRVRAPGWIQRMGMEWCFRMVQEPRRLFMRYLVTNTQFICVLLATFMKRP